MNAKILIADDDPGMVRLLRMALEPTGLIVREAYDSVSLLTRVQREPPDLIIMDVQMPGGNGLSACEMLASDRASARVPVIILTGRSDQATLDRCTALGARHVQKGPEAVAQIKRLVQQILSPVLAQ
ncbi:MAG TPA: response regulator [Tepidisphaeraceae bacterium]|nr:response regulator [Tepidisphaeraceae bacterium]